MLVYQGTKSTFREDVIDGNIEDKIQEQIYLKIGRHTPKNELRSWKNSMQYMDTVLSDNEIPDKCGVAIEYNIPMTAKRVDFILSGFDDCGNGHANIIELKQWEEANCVTDLENIVETFVGGGVRQVAHPCYQAWSYAETIQDYNEAVQNNSIELHPCAFLHNYKNSEQDPLKDACYSSILSLAPLFERGDIRILRSFLKAHITKGDNKEILDVIDNGKIKPSKSLQDSLVEMLHGSQEFILLDDQKVVYEKAFNLALKCHEDGKKRVMIVEGGPGTGKSVVAINLLVYLTKAGLISQYVSKNSAPRNVYSKLLREGGTKNKDIKFLFKGSGGYVDALPDSFDALIVDEAHRLNLKSGLYGNVGENQTKEIINASLFSIFFIDRHQRITLKDAGSISEIEKWANFFNADIIKEELQSQFRCNGSNGYLSWIDNVLEITETANYSLADIDYDFKVCDSPQELEGLVREKNTRNKARLLAGYCWEWPTSSKNDPNSKDIIIGDWGISWNLNNTDTFAIDENSINEAGCIHTSQGLEFDYVGIIIGDDLSYCDGRIITDASKRAKSDASLKGIKKIAKEDPERAHKIADEIIKNTYRTLMTRGMKGCYVYCVDKNLSNHLKKQSGRYEYDVIDM